ncbi:recombinase family protein [Calothrix sp. NIES-3974]|uniref:recombinase family protein n=1 Tax=Calothrix sp. NIES-3974 TaxID=2005462 RepID=UPI000B5F7633|nr:recombinase family protein [Calothrix sp. NIES-3974]BAZ07760.1 site-specific recombinase [Calothrix sp. NIES-3974]
MTAEKSPTESVWERLEKGRRLKALRGGYAGYGSPPYGLTSVNGELVDHPQEQAVIELIRRHHKSGKSLQQIANWLNERGYTTKRGQKWQRISVKRVLDRMYGKNPSACQTHRDLDQEHQPVLSGLNTIEPMDNPPVDKFDRGMEIK